jgi:hypothetical protein
MTAGINTRNLDAGRISLPRAGFGALLAGTLLAGSLLGAATYAAANMASTNAAVHAAAISAALPNESVVVRDARIKAGNGQLAGDVRVTSVATGAAAAAATAGAVRNGQLATGNGPLAGDVRALPNGGTMAIGVTKNTNFPAGRDGFGFDQPVTPAPAPVGRDGFGFGPTVAPAPTVTVQHATGRGALQ